MNIMRNLFLLLVVALFTFSCSDNCTQDAYSERVSSARGNTYTVCHDGKTKTLNDVESYNDHIAHGDSDGACETLSTGGLTFADGKNVEISCDRELPFYATNKGVLYRFSAPK